MTRCCSPDEAVARAWELHNKGGQYVLGTGDYRPYELHGEVCDLPWTMRDGKLGSDCAGFAISWCYKLKRHRPGFNVGSWATVANDINCNSALEDARHNNELFIEITSPAPGALLLYPTIEIKGHDGEMHRFIGHVGIVTGVSRCLEWDWENPPWALLDILHCCGPNGRRPAVVKTDGHIWQHHDTIWPKPQHRSAMIWPANWTRGVGNRWVESP